MKASHIRSKAATRAKILKKRFPRCRVQTTAPVQTTGFKPKAATRAKSHVFNLSLLRFKTQGSSSLTLHWCDQGSGAGTTAGCGG
ncbi:hypothetical protein ACFX2I_003214 [Malus domestica]